jgi:hypothetical protein
VCCLSWSALHGLPDGAVWSRGGTVSITGVTIQTSTAVSSVGSGISGNSDNSPAPQALKTRTAAFNGTLGFWTLGVTIEVSAVFHLKRCGTPASRWSAPGKVCWTIAMYLALWVELRSLVQRPEVHCFAQHAWCAEQQLALPVGSVAAIHSVLICVLPCSMVRPGSARACLQGAATIRSTVHLPRQAAFTSCLIPS